MSVEKIISEIKLERENIKNTLNEFKTASSKNKFLHLIEVLKNPVYLFIEVVIVTVLSIILLPFIYNFIFIVPLSPLTFTVYLLLIVFLIIIPFNLILNKLCSRFKIKYFKKLNLESKLIELTKLEKEFLQVIFQNYRIETKSKKVDTLTELELDELALKTSLVYNTYNLTSNGIESKIEIIDFHKNISGRYLLYEENLKNQYGEIELIIDNNIIWKNYKQENVNLRLLPAHRGLIKLLFNFKNISRIKRVEFTIEQNYLRVIIHEPAPPDEKWLSARIPETLAGFRKFIVNHALTNSIIL